jgi:hypothetical protein
MRAKLQSRLEARWVRICVHLDLEQSFLFSAFFAFFTLFCGYSVLYLQPFGMECTRLVGTFVSMRAEIIALGL